MSDGTESTPPEVTGELTRRLSAAPLRVLAVITGFALVRGVMTLVVRYCLRLRRPATATLRDGTLFVEAETRLFGRVVRRFELSAPLADLRAVMRENRQRHLHLVVGFGALVVGTLVGVQYLLEGLRAGFPYLSLVGAGILAAGVLIDVLVFALIPAGGGSRLRLALGPWQLLLSGVDPDAASRFLAATRRSWDAGR